ncbi:hypothetical protein AC1031_004907 [Aphanomyces cochlioides]|nr:hypothetical protein AC1031_004907 [Aphanomyces cochlioides]
MENSESSRDKAAEAPSLDVSGVAESPLATTEPGRIIRKKFAAVDDVVLLQVVNAFRPWRAPAGTSRGIMKVFDDIAAHCAKHKLFGVKKWPRPTHSSDQCKLMRQSGTTEEFNEREMLLQEIVSQIDDWNEHVQQEKLQKSAKAMALLKSGEVLKRLAMDELDDDDANDDDDVDSDDVEESSTAEA